MKKNILVTGGTGFLGSALSIRLVDLGHNVTVFDNNSRGSVSKIESILDRKKIPVLYTTREEMQFSSNSERMNFGLELAEFMAILVRKISNKLCFIISKGGITTQLLLQKGLNFNQVDLNGQILPGLSIVTSNSDQFDLPVVTFPGNLGNEKTLLESFRLMESIS